MSNNKGIAKKKDLTKMPHLVAPVNALDEQTAKTLYENQKIILEHLIEFSKLVLSIKSDMRKIIEEEITKQFDERKIMLEGLYKKTLICAKLLMDAGHFTQGDINKKYEELKAKK